MGHILAAAILYLHSVTKKIVSQYLKIRQFYIKMQVSGFSWEKKIRSGNTETYSVTVSWRKLPHFREYTLCLASITTTLYFPNPRVKDQLPIYQRHYVLSYSRQKFGNHYTFNLYNNSKQ